MHQHFLSLSPDLSYGRSESTERLRIAQPLILMVLAAAFFLAVGTASAATVARWTPAQASAKVRGTCKGVGNPVAGKYLAFKCQKGGLVYAKVRPDGRWLCYSRVSLAAVSKACMTVPGQG